MRELLLVLLALLVLVISFAGLRLEVFEDGSFVLNGCAPWAVCHETQPALNACAQGWYETMGALNLALQRLEQ